jgi:hypothetical protein
MPPSSLTLIGQSWSFWQKQPVLSPVMLWLLFAPTAASSLMLDRLLKDGTTIQWASNQTILLILGLLLSWLLALWGTCCVLVVGKRILQHKAGRTRTSFKAVRKQAAKALIPLMLTSALRDCYTILWTLLLIVPGIVYALRTSFYAVAAVCEGKPYQEAMKRSKDAMEGRLGTTVLTILALNILLFLPPVLIDQFAADLIPKEDRIPAILITIFTSGLRSIAVVLSLLSLIHLYAFLRKGGPREVIPDEIETEE